ncbi:conserved hypothetical protein [Microsporum canis CBS 113480]|uniref:Uncharacterized protein n=1 Tax=Arthroderma otae (strain ATCC MYA-4605 / CBS 113480) TaxID=554155 RepID=C5FNL9_ARTOC|nr:conserved hypothetical protein [Microsporum canis CBS 113480]EEQ31722.1 conserved hypothetical protein [Microsporum canis CBS 113480]
MLKPEVFSYATYYGALAWLGYYLLWTAALRHGARAAMVAVKRTNRFPDGTPLIQRYTPIAALDRQLISAVIFYHGLLDGTDPAHGLLLVDVHSTMQATALCIMAQTRASLPFTASLLIPTVWGIVNQFYGAAFVYPLYLLCQTVWHGFEAFPAVNDSRINLALVASAVWSSILPLAFLFPLFVPSCVARRQRAIALYRASPIVLTLLQWMGEHVPLERVFPTVPESAPYLVVAVTAAAAHLYAILGAAVASYSPPVTMKEMLYRIYLPSTSRPKLPAAVLSRAAHEFLQYDMLILAAAFILCANVLLAPVLPVATWLIIASLFVAMVALGPGAVLALSFALRWYLQQ